MILTLLLAQLSYAQTVDSNLLKKVESKFREPPRFGKEPVLKNSRMTMKPPAPTMDEILASRVVQKALTRLGSIQDLKSDKIQAITERMYVDVHEMPDAEGFFYIVDNNAEVTKRVHMQYTVGLNDDVAMYEPPRHYIQVFERKNVSPYDSNFTWRPEAYFSLNRGNSSWISDILDDSNASSSSGYQIGTRFMANMAGRFQLGLSALYESSNYQLEAGEARYKNISFGVTAKTPTLEWGGFPWRLYTDVRIGPSGTLVIEGGNNEQEIDMRTTSLQLGWERPHRNALGEFVWGFYFQRDWPKLRNQKEYIAQDSSESTNDIIGIQIGQGFEW